MNRTFVAILLVIAGLIGLLMSACGGFFAVIGIANPKDQYIGGALVISIPSLLIGLALLWFVKKRYEAWRAVGQAVAQIQSPPSGPPSDAM
jgi:hypothetical protein